MNRKSTSNRAAMLWFLAAALSLIAAVLNYVNEGVLRWPLPAATLFLGAMGVVMLMRARSGG